MTCLAPPGYYCSAVDGTVLLCQANRYCLGGIYPPRLCPGSTWSAVGSASIDACRDNMDTAFGVTLSLLLIFLFVFLGVWLCCATLLPVAPAGAGYPVYPPAYPPPTYPPPEATPLLNPTRAWVRYPAHV